MRVKCQKLLEHIAIQFLHGNPLAQNACQVSKTVGILPIEPVGRNPLASIEDPV